MTNITKNWLEVRAARIDDMLQIGGSYGRTDINLLNKVNSCSDMLFTGTKKECEIFLSGMAAYKYNFNKQVENDKDNL